MSANQIKLLDPKVGSEYERKEFSLIKVPSIDENTWRLRVENKNYWIKMNDLLNFLIMLNAMTLHQSIYSIIKSISRMSYVQCVVYIWWRQKKRGILIQMVFFFRTMECLQNSPTYTFIEKYKTNSSQLFGAFKFIQWFTNWIKGWEYFR